MIGREPLSLSKEFEDALNVLERSASHVFLTGRAGTGKSTLLELFRKTSRRKVVVLAPTGIAALNVKGQTIHSFFGFPPKMLNPNDIRKRRNWRSYLKIETIVIDEISMVRADMVDNIDRFLRINREIDEPFGGIKMIFIGDLFQLPPIVSSQVERHFFKSRYESPYFFSSDVVKNGLDMEVIQLHTVYRQDERFFVRILDNIRTNNMDYDDLETLNHQSEVEPDPHLSYITLTSRRNTAEAINNRHIKAIDEPPFFYNASIQGQFEPRLFPTDAALSLKKGAQVMFIKNDPKKRFVNGTIGKVVTLDHESIHVEIKDSEYNTVIIELEKLEWEITKYDLHSKDEISSKVVGSFNQFPVKLAWAITIHKSQGKTFNHVIIDLGQGAFAYGQTYVALSRCRTLGGIILKRPIRPQDIRVDQQVVEFYEHIRYYL